MKTALVVVLFVAAIVAAVFLRSHDAPAPWNEHPRNAASNPPSESTPRLLPDGNREHRDKARTNAGAEQAKTAPSDVNEPSTATLTAPDDVPAAVRSLRDTGVIEYYKTQLRQISKIQERLINGHSLDASTKRVLAVSHAVKACIEQQRFWYLGHKSNLPQYSHLQSAGTRYVATTIGDTAMVFELPKAEFPDVFHEDTPAIK